ncbi:MAG: hypothetical protein GQ535_17910 [Rhodobacteraceae bacterium]|nr:hypothetical protein [Paracoccaceae bacterium]
MQTIPYELLRSQANTIINFEEHLRWSNQAVSIHETLDENGASFATAFVGQVINGQISGTQVADPLALTPLVYLDLNFAYESLRSGNTFDSSQGGRASKGSIFQTIFIGGNNRDPANMLTGWAGANRNKHLTSMSPRIQIYQSGDWSDNSVIGIEPVALLFDDNQTAVGFSIVDLHLTNQQHWVNSSTQGTTVQVKFFRQNGTLISQISFPLNGRGTIAFARCGGAVDIAGIQITNSSSTGLAFDDFIFGVPLAVPNSLPDEGPLSQPDKVQSTDNPLNVDLCSFYTS